jgi:hypothetical protein
MKTIPAVNNGNEKNKTKLISVRHLWRKARSPSRHLFRCAINFSKQPNGEEHSAKLGCCTALPSRVRTNNKVAYFSSQATTSKQSVVGRRWVGPAKAFSKRERNTHSSLSPLASTSSAYANRTDIDSHRTTAPHSKSAYLPTVCKLVSTGASGHTFELTARWSVPSIPRFSRLFMHILG